MPVQEADGLLYETRGDGEAVLLIHGSHIADSFLPLMTQPALTDGFRLVRSRRRGFRDSELRPDSGDVRGQARDALGLLEHLGVDRAHVVGHSFGGLVATQLALDEPGLVQTLVLLEPVLFTRTEAAGLHELMAPLEELYRSGDAATAVDRFLSNDGQNDWRAEIRDTVPGGAEQAIDDAATFFDVDLPAIQQRTFEADGDERLAMPVLHISGADTTHPNRHAVIAAMASNLEAVEIPDVGHGLQMAKPAAVAQPIAAFLLRHPIA